MNGRAQEQEPKRTILFGSDIGGIIEELAGAVLKHCGDKQFSLIGIQTGGIHLASRLKKIMEEKTSMVIPVGVLDITLYRDDILMGLSQPLVKKTDIPFEVTDSRIVLIDDVLYTGRTIRAALDAIIDLGRPKFIKLLVLVDRGFREYPIHADFTGIFAETSENETVKVQLKEMGYPEDRIAVFEKTKKG